jgi:hypothetical protein
MGKAPGAASAQGWTLLRMHAGEIPWLKASGVAGPTLKRPFWRSIGISPWFSTPEDGLAL